MKNFNVIAFFFALIMASMLVESATGRNEKVFFAVVGFVSLFTASVLSFLDKED